MSLPSHSFQCQGHLLLLLQTVTVSPEGKKELRFVIGGQPMGQIVFHCVIIIIDHCPCDVSEHLSPEAFGEVLYIDKGHNPAT